MADETRRRGLGGPHRALVGLGSDVEPGVHLPRAVDALRKRFDLLALSSAYATRAVGRDGTPDAKRPEFLNAAAVIATDLGPGELRAALRSIEASLGRRRTPDRFAPRVIDLDVVLYDDRPIEESGMSIPDPELLVQAYLAVPAAEAAPDWRHPRTGEALSDIAARLLARLAPADRPRPSGLELGVAPQPR